MSEQWGLNLSGAGKPGSVREQRRQVPKDTAAESPTDLLWEAQKHEAGEITAGERRRNLEQLQSEVLYYSFLSFSL